MKNSSVLITGGAGFIGSSLSATLQNLQTRIVCLDNFDVFYEEQIKVRNILEISGSPHFTLVRGDIRDRALMDKICKEYNIGIVVHLAAKAGVRPSIADPLSYFDVNVNGTIVLLEAMKRNGINKLINASSSSVYGNNVKTPYSETDNVDFPISPYAASKKSGELVTHTYHHLFGMDVINLRFFTVYGPRQRPDLAIHRFFRALYDGKPIDVYGDGSTSRDYTYIDDIVSGIQGSMNYLMQHSGVYETINLGNSRPVKLGELINLIERITGKIFLKNHLPMQEGDVLKTFADIRKAKKLLQYDPTTPIEEGLMRFKNWYENN
jgi:UDP-glucuronate 4-epimerase